MTLDETLRRRAFELQDLEIWCARNARHLYQAHDCYYYCRQLEALTHIPADTEDVNQWLAESEEQWPHYIARVRDAHRHPSVKIRKEAKRYL